MSVKELITDHLDLWTGALTHKNGSGRNASGKNRKIELTGIKKLRELILELAVRGKLVEQDPSDEPASVLLAKIAEEKAQLVKEGKIKKPKKLPAIAEEVKPFELPKGWQWARLSDALRVINGRAYKKHEMLQEGTPLLRVGNLFTSNEWYYSDLQLEKDKYIDNGDLIYAWSASFGPFIWEGGRAIYHYHIWKLELFDHSSTNKHFLYNYLKAVTEEIKSSGSGIAMIHMTKSKMEELVVPLPPLDEQQRIVEKVDELMALCDRLEQQVGDQLEAHKVLVDTLLDALTRSSDATELAENWSRVAEHFDTLFTTEASIDKLKKTILQLAVMGRLVEQDPNDEPASVLLDKIAEEKDRLVKEEKIKKPKSLPSIAKKDEPFNLPSGWSWARVGDILSIKHGFAFKSSHFCEKRTPYVLTTPGNFHEQGGFRDRLDRTKYYDGPVSDEFILSPRDMIIPMTEQAPGLLGSAAFVPNDDNTYLHNQRLGKLIIHSKLITPGFIYWFFNSQLLRSELARTCTGTTVRHTSPEKVKSALVPVTSPEEQHRIVQKVDELMALCDQLKTRLSESGQTRSQLAETVVEQAVS